MTTRRAKQIIYGTLYGIIWLVILLGIYYLFVKPAFAPVVCTGPSCGVEAARTLTTSTLTTFMAGSGSATYLAKVTNVNADFGAVAFDYNFNFYNASGTVMFTIPGSSFIYQNQVKYLIAPNIAPIDEPYASLDLSNVQWVTSSSMGAPPQFVFTNVQAKTGSSTISVRGTLTNNDIASFNKILIIAIFKDGSGNPVGASQTELDNVAPNTAKNFSVMYPSLSGVNPANNELDAYGLRTSM
jgi:hypothetical protein